MYKQNTIAKHVLRSTEMSQHTVRMELKVDGKLISVNEKVVDDAFPFWEFLKECRATLNNITYAAVEAVAEGEHPH